MLEWYPDRPHCGLLGVFEGLVGSLPDLFGPLGVLLGTPWGPLGSFPAPLGDLFAPSWDPSGKGMPKKPPSGSPRVPLRHVWGGNLRVFTFFFKPQNSTKTNFGQRKCKKNEGFDHLRGKPPERPQTKKKR